MTLKKLVQLVSQSYALPFEDVYKIFLTLNSVDQLLEIIDLANQNNWTIEKAHENWKLDGKM